MGYPAGSAWRGNAARGGGSPSAAFRNSLAGRFGIPGNLANAANDFHLPTPANDNFRVPKGGLRIARGAGRLLGLIGVGLALYELYDYLQPGGQRALDIRGSWDLLDSCGRPPTTLRWNQSYGGNCALTDSVISDGPDQGPQTGFIKGFTLWANTIPPKYYINGVSITADPAARYQQVFGPAPGIRNNAAFEYPMWDAPFISNPWPVLNPHGMPINQFLPVPEHLPYSVLPHLTPNPDAPASTQLEVGNSIRPGGLATPIGDTVPLPPPVGVPATPTNVVPGTAVEVTPQGMFHILPEHVYEPPGRNVKERKFIANVGTSYLIRRLYDAATELEDFVTALYQSIEVPPLRGVNADRQAHMRLQKPRPTFWKDPFGKWHKKWPSLAEKSRYVYEHAGDINLQKAIQNIAKNEIKDRIFGKVGRVAAKAARNTHNQGLGSPSRSYQLTRH